MTEETSKSDLFLLARLLRLLRSEQTPLGDAASVLGISRQKALHLLSRLEQDGFEFIKHPFQGCILTREPQRLLAVDIVSRLEHAHTWDVEVHAKTKSTNDLGLRHGEKNLPTPCAIFAEEQTAGRGRLGRRWVSNPSTSLCFSAVVRPSLPAARWHLLAAVAAVALTRAIQRTTGATAVIKWPNDLLLGGKKLGGILVESVMHDPSRAFAVMGIGLNVQSMLFDGGLQNRATTLQDEVGFEISRSALAAAILDALSELMPGHESSTAPLLAEFRARSVLLGRQVSAIRPDQCEINGIAEEIDEEGRLIIRTVTGKSEVLTAAEVTLTNWDV